MATFTDTFRLIVDTQVDKAKSGFSSLKSEIDGTEGSWNKLKVAGGGAIDAIKANATGLAIGAGTAIATFAVKAVGDFNSLAMGAGELADKTGLAVDQASRFQEVAGDLGIPVSALETSLNRMNKTAATTPAAFDAIGASIARSKDGTIDVQQTFLNVIGALNRMPDAAQRAAAAQAIFGKGWQSMSELVGEGADKLKSQLAGVEQQKIVNPAQVAQARDMRDTLDNLHDSAQDVTLTLGQALAPAFAEVAHTAANVAGPLASIIENIDKLNQVSKPPADKPLGWLDLPEHVIKKPLDLKGNWDLFMQSFKESMGQGASAIDASIDPALLDQWAASTSGAFKLAEDGLQGFTDKMSGDFVQANHDASSSVEENNQKLYDSQAASKAAADAQKEIADQAQRVSDIMHEQADALTAQADAAQSAADSQRTENQALQTFSERLSDAKATTDDVTDAAISLAKAHADAAADTAAAGGAALDAAGKLDAENSALLNTAGTAKGAARAAILQYIGTLNGIPTDILTEINAAIDRGDIATAESLLQSTSRTRQANVQAQATNVAATNSALDSIAHARSVPYIPTVGGNATARAGGGIVQPGEITLEGEHGPELAIHPPGTNIVPAGQTADILDRLSGSGAGGETNVNITINAGLGTDARALEQAVVNALNQHVRNNGPANIRKMLGVSPVGIITP